MTPKQQRFVEEYLIDLNATQAAIRAGYSERTARQAGTENLSKPVIASAIENRRAELSRSAEVTQERIVDEFCRMGFYDPADIASRPLNGPEDIAKLPEDVRRAIVGWSWDRSGNFTVKLADKSASLVNLGRHLGMFKDRMEHTGKDGGPIEYRDLTDDEIDARIAAHEAANAGSATSK